MQGHEIYVRLTDPSGKHRPVVNSHRVWDAGLFVEAQRRQYDSPSTKPEDRRTIAVVSRAAYLKSKG